MHKITCRAIATEDYETSTDGVTKGDFVYGYYYFCRRRNTGIIVADMTAECGGVGSGIVQVEIEVDYKTVGQYTGLHDKQDKEIYEGDVVFWDNTISEVKYFDASFWIEAHTLAPEPLSHMLSSTLEIKGNKFENLELLSNGKGD